MTGNGTPSRAELHAHILQLTLRGLTHREIAEQTGHTVAQIRYLLYDPDGSKARKATKGKTEREKARYVFERDQIRNGLLLDLEPAPPTPDRKQEFDVSGSDGIRYVVIPIGLPPAGEEKEGRSGWTVFDTSFKQRAGLFRTSYALAWRDCRYFNAHDKLEEDAA